MSGALYYTRSSGTEMFCMYSIETRADLCDGAYTMLSTDNGHTWSEPAFHEAEIVRPTGSFADSRRSLWWTHTETASCGSSTKGSSTATILYRACGATSFATVSSDGGRTWDTDELMIEEGEEYDETHPFPNV